MSDRRERLKDILDGLLSETAAQWAGLVSRDGLCVMQSFKREFPVETFSAMTATVVGAAEIALADLGGGRTRRVIAETERVRLIAVGATADLLLVSLSPQEAGPDGFVARVEAAADRVRVTVAEG